MKKRLRILIILFITILVTLLVYLAITQTLDIMVNLKTSYEAINKIPYRWNHHNLTYSIKNQDSCFYYDLYYIKAAFKEIQEKANHEITFKEVNGSADIQIFCSNESLNIINCRGYACGQTKVNIMGIWIVSAEINLPKIEPLGRKIQIYCGDDYPRAEIHEILHALGFNHVNNTGSVMYPDVSKCSDRIPEIDQEIINKIKEIY